MSGARDTGEAPTGLDILRAFVRGPQGLDPSLSRVEADPELVLDPEDVKDVDDFIDDYTKDSEPERYARLFFHLHRLPESLWIAFETWLSTYELYFTHGGKRWRVTGCSSLGDIYFKAPEDAPPGSKPEAWRGPYYDERGAFPAECSDWSSKP